MKAYRLFWGTLLAILFGCAGVLAEGGFQTDYAGIDAAAKSVLMLYCYDDDSRLLGTGSGFMAFNNRTLVTNYHVIEGAHSVIATSDDGVDYYSFDLLAADPEKDLALLDFVHPTDLTPLVLEESQKTLRGQPVVAIGSPEGIQNTVSLGNISSFVWEMGAEWIQFTAPISHGSSGGALFNDQGLVIGITSASLTQGQNLNYAIPIQEAISLYQAHKGDESKPIYKWTAKAAKAPDSAQWLTEVKIENTMNGWLYVHWENAPGLCADEGVEYLVSWWLGKNDFYTYNITDKTHYFIPWVPECRYEIYVQQGMPPDEDMRFPDEPSLIYVTGAAPKTDSYKASLSMVYSLHGGDPATAIGGSVSLRAGDLETAGSIRDFYIQVKAAAGDGAKSKERECVYMMYAPSGFIYVRTDYLDIGSVLSEQYLPMNDMLASLFRFEEPPEKGKYRLSLLIDGSLAAEGSFDMK